MCASCGCGIPNDNHGDERHINFDQLKAAAEAAGVTVQEVVSNMQEMAKKESA